jgi:signal transduction histidine kinase
MTGPEAGSCKSTWFMVALAAEYSALNTPRWRFPTWIEFASTLLLGESYAWVTSTWAYLLYSGVVIVLAYFVHRLRVRQIEVELTTLFHGRLSERARIARDLNDSLLQTIEASKLIADDALDPSTDLARMRETMGRLSNWLGQATGEGQAALDSLGAAGYDANDLASSFRRAAEECLTRRSTKFVLLVTGANKDMHPMVRDEVYRLGCDVIHNACHRGEVGRVEIELTYGSSFCLRVRSISHPPGSAITGTGEDEHFDLDAMQKRAQRFGASLKMNGSSSASVEITLTVPGGVIFQSASPVLPRWLADLWNRLRSKKDNAS